VNVAYKHLEARLKIGELTLGQWAGLFCGVMLTIGWGVYLSPLPPMLTLVTAIYLGGVPVAAVFLASFSEFDLWLLAGSALRWRRLDGRFLPGPGAGTPGYRVSRPADDARHGARERDSALDLVALWES
jgi:hypothetical protein